MLAGLFIVLLLLLLLGFPVLLVIGLLGFAGFVLAQLDPALFPQRMFAALDSFSLLAMPYFILAGELMTRGGLSKRLVEFSEKLVGHMRGGLGHASILACTAFGNVSGSATAATAAIGSVLIPAMKDRGYRPGLAAALTGCSGLIGSIIPPSMVMIVYGSVAGVSIAGLFLGGYVPGLMMMAGLMLALYVHALLPGFPELRAVAGRFSVRSAVASLPQVWTAVAAPVIILGGIISGIFTATEAGVVACVYAFVIAFVVYRTVSLRDAPAILVDAAVTTAMVVGIISVAGALGWLLTYLDFNEVISGLILGISGNPYVVILALLGIMLVLTMFVESLAVLIILIPVIAQVGRTFGLDPLHLGICVVLATQIGAVTPPVAVGLFVATGVAKTDYDRTMRHSIPFVLVLIAVLLLVLFVPGLATWVQNCFLGR